jgi:uncharacterized protein
MTPPLTQAKKRWPTLLAAMLLVPSLLLGCSTLDEAQRQWIFQPSDRSWSGAQAASQGLDDVWVDFQSGVSGQDVKLHGLWAAQNRKDAPVLLYLHGARWDVRGSAPRIRRMQELGFAVLAIDYRGFGRSTQQLPSEAMATEDARAAWNWLKKHYPERDRYIFGHSLGGAIAVHLAADVDDEHGLIVEGSFTSIPDVVSTFKWGWLPVKPLITQRFASADRIGQVRSPILVVHGSEDRTIAPTLGRALFDKAPEPKRWILVEGGSHHNTNSMGQPLYRQALRELFGLEAHSRL